jgi:phosphoribosylglycinamide formyltransferase-1
LEGYEFDYIILAGYMRMLSADFVANFPHKIINIHPADTTQHQGLHGYEWAFENHLEETKITIHFVDVGLDTGKIIAQKTVDLKGAKTLEEIEQRGLAVEHQFYPETLYYLFDKS